MESKSLVEIVDNILKSKLKYEAKYNTFFEALSDQLREDGSKNVLVDNDTGRTWTGDEMLNAITTLAVNFSEYGIEKGDVVAFFCPNSDLHLLGKLSIWSIGAVYTGLISKSPLRELENVITKTNATYLVGSKDTIDLCNKFRSQSTTIKKLFVIENNIAENIPSIHSMITRKVWNEKELFSKLVSKVKSTDLCKISFSSGTTGEPKPVTEIQARLISFCALSPPEIGFITALDSFALIPPLQHMGGTMISSAALLNKARLVVFSQFNLNTVITDFQKNCVTLAVLTPSQLNLLNRTQSNNSEFVLKKVITGGEFLHQLVGEEFIKKFKVQYLSQIYGSTEIGWICSCPASMGTNNLRTSGIPLPGFQVKIIDLETGVILGANEIGEICAKGPQTTGGYLNNEKANRESFDEQSFFKTGDVGYFDENGFIYIIDRIKELIKYNTQQVSPTELQNILLQHEAVKEAVVVGIRDDIFGQLPKAFVVLQDSFKDKVEESELLQFVNSQVMDFKKLRGGLNILKELPKTSVGKIERKALKSM